MPQELAGRADTQAGEQPGPALAHPLKTADRGVQSAHGMTSFTYLCQAEAAVYEKRHAPRASEAGYRSSFFLSRRLRKKPVSWAAQADSSRPPSREGRWL